MSCGDAGAPDRSLSRGQGDRVCFLRDSNVDQFMLSLPEHRKHTSSQAADDARPSDARMHDGDDISKLTLEGRVKVGTALDGGQAVAVCEFREYANIAVVFELSAYMPCYFQ